MKERKNIFDNINLSPKRLETENREQYKARRQVNDRLVKDYLNGTMIYNALMRVRIPQVKDGKIVKILVDEVEEIQWTDQYGILGPYNTNHMGSLKNRH